MFQNWLAFIGWGGIINLRLDVLEHWFMNSENSKADRAVWFLTWITTAGMIFFLPGCTVLPPKTVVQQSATAKTPAELRATAGLAHSLRVPESTATKTAGFIEVEVLGVGRVKFPDTMTLDEIRDVVRKNFGPPRVVPSNPFPVVTAPPPSGDELLLRKKWALEDAEAQIEAFDREREASDREWEAFDRRMESFELNQNLQNLDWDLQDMRRSIDQSRW
jgi:hypothetical protein